MIYSVDKLKGFLKNAEVKGSTIYADCPKCGKHEFGISINEDNHPFGCFRKKKCGWTGNIYVLLDFLGIPIEGKVNVHKVENLLLKKQEQAKVEDSITSVDYPVRWKRVYDNPYLNSRGFTPDDYRRYEVGEIPLYRGYIFFAIKMYGVLFGWVGRATTKMYTRKYQNSVTDFRQLLYGYDDVSNGDTVCIVEGVFDKKSTDRVMGAGMSCVGTFGGHISEAQIKLLKAKNVKSVVLMHESDILGIVKKEAARLSKEFDTKVAYIPLGNDPGGMTPQAIADCINRAEKAGNFIINHVGYDIQK